MEAFIGDAQTGDLVALEGLFTEDVVSYSDGCGLVRAARVPVVGRERVAKFIAAFSSHYWNGITLSWREVNGQESVLLSRLGEPVGLVTTDASEEGIHQIMWLMRPSKLTAVSTSKLMFSKSENQSVGGPIEDSGLHCRNAFSKITITPRIRRMEFWKKRAAL